MKPVLLAAIVLLTVQSAGAETRAQFCDRWHQVCVRCDGLGASVSKKECLQNCNNRQRACLSNGCYRFIAIGPQCQKAASR